MAKRSWRRTVWGNVNGYERGRRVEEFGDEPWSERVAEEWVLGATRADAELIALGVIQRGTDNVKA